jgi:hypothetical protein
MCLFDNIELIFVGETEHEKVALAEGSYHDISTFSSDSHGIKRLVRFNSVIA